MEKYIELTSHFMSIYTRIRVQLKKEYVNTLDSELRLILWFQDAIQ